MPFFYTVKDSYVDPDPHGSVFEILSDPDPDWIRFQHCPLDPESALCLMRIHSLISHFGLKSSVVKNSAQI